MEPKFQETIETQWNQLKHWCDVRWRKLTAIPVQDTIKLPAVQVGVVSLIIIFLMFVFTSTQSSALQQRVSAQEFSLQQKEAELASKQKVIEEKDAEITRQNNQIATDQRTINTLQSQIPPDPAQGNGNSFIEYIQNLFQRAMTELGTNGLKWIVKQIVKFILHLFNVYAFDGPIDAL